jgi:RNA polymerase sigma-70 factor (ECF subfamily)
MFEELLSFKKIVFRICLGFSRNPWEAEDLTQEVYLKAYLKLDSLRDPGVKKEWLFRIARNTCLDHLKKQNRNPLAFQETNPGDDPPDPRTPETQALQDEEQARLKAAISSLPRKQREVFVLKEYASLSYKEIAATLDVREGTVMSRLNRARQAIVREMNNPLTGGNQ